MLVPGWKHTKRSTRLCGKSTDHEKKSSRDKKRRNVLKLDKKFKAEIKQIEAILSDENILNFNWCILIATKSSMPS